MTMDNCQLGQSILKVDKKMSTAFSQKISRKIYSSHLKILWVNHYRKTGITPSRLI